MSALTIIAIKPDLLHVDVPPGCHIQAACKEAIDLARQRAKKVVFSFNGIKVLATSGDTPKALADQYVQDQNEGSAAWRSSPEGLRHAQELEEQRIRTQQSIDELLANLAAAVVDEAKLVAWIGAFADLNDNTRISFDKLAVATQLKAAGYASGAEVGITRKDLESDKSMLARYIVGQAIENLQSGMPIHPIAAKFSAEYAAF